MVQSLEHTKISDPVNHPITLYPMIHVDQDETNSNKFIVSITTYLPELSAQHPVPSLVNNENETIVPVLTEAGIVQARAFIINYIPATSAGDIAPFFLWVMKITYELSPSEQTVDYVDVQINMNGLAPGPDGSRGTVTTPKLSGVDEIE